MKENTNQSSKRNTKHLDLTDPEVCEANKEIGDALVAILNETFSVPSLITKETLPKLKTFDDVRFVAVMYQLLYGYQGFFQMKRDLGDLVKRFTQDEVRTLLSGSASQPFGKSLNEVVQNASQVQRVHQTCPIVVVINVTKTEVQYAYVNVTNQNHTLKTGNYRFQEVTIAIEPSLFSSEGLVTGDPIQEFVLVARGKSRRMVGMSSDCTNWSSIVEAVPLDAMPFSLGKIWEGLIDIRMNLIVDGEEYEERAHLLFDSDLRS